MNKTIRPFLIFLSALVTAGHVNTVTAHTLSLSLGADISATDMIQINCSTDQGAATDHLFFQIQTNAWQYDPAYTPNNSRLNAQVGKQGIMSTTAPANDFVNNSPAIRAPGGNGSYYVLVNKTAPGAVALTVTLHCLSADESIHTGTDWIILQQQ